MGCRQPRRERQLIPISIIYSLGRVRAALGSPGIEEGRAVPTLVPNSSLPTVMQRHSPSPIPCCKVMIDNDG